MTFLIDQQKGINGLVININYVLSQTESLEIKNETSTIEKGRQPEIVVSAFLKSYWRYW